MDNITTDANNKLHLNSNAIKMIAILAMTIDHLTWTFLPGYRTDVLTLSLHIIGRLTAPIMMYFIAEGYFHTRNVKKYVTRMFVFAFISHFAYALMFDKNFIPFQNSVFDQTSVMWPLALGLTALAIDKSESPKLKFWHKNLLISLCIIAAFCGDWSSPAALSILYMGRNRGNFKKQMLWLVLWIAMYATVYAVFLNFAYGVIQIFVVMAIPILFLYSGERGKWNGMKWFFYTYYPFHLAVLGLIRIFLL